MYFLLPGLGNSGPRHWQSFWEKSLPNTRRVDQEDWENPDMAVWTERLNSEIRAQTEGVILIAHSLGVALAVHWFHRHSHGNVVGAFLVSPSDVDSEERTPDSVRSFSPMPLPLIRVPTVLVASENDPYVSCERARYFSARWGSSFVSAGNLGHINSESGLGEWEWGRTLLRRLEGETTR